MKNLLTFVIIFIGVILLSSCAIQQKDNINYETKVIQVESKYTDCGELKLKNIGIQLENPKYSSAQNQKILTRNIILLDYKLREAESLLNCYRNQVKENK